MNVLSLFDGISCGQIALERAKIKVDNYFASEIDKYAVKVTMKNYPNTIQLGDVTKISYKNGVLYSENGEFNVGKIDLLIGGSPCQGFSFAGKQLNFEDPRSKLFFEYERILKEVNPEYFLLENVKMKKEYKDVISECLNVEPIEINSSLVSAQDRRRLYWTNIKFNPDIPDKKIYIKDILNIKNNEPCFDKILMTKANFTVKVRKNYIDKKELAIFLRKHKIESNLSCKDISNKLNIPITKVEHWFRNDNCFSIPDADIWNDIKILLNITDNKYDKAITEFEIKNNNFDMAKRIYHINGKHPTLTTLTGGGQRKNITDGIDLFYLNPVHCERLQTVPDNYTEGASNTQRFKMLGNAWTVDIIAHIFSFIK